MLENAIIYKDRLEPEYADTRSWFRDNQNADRIVAWNGHMWRIQKIHRIFSDDSGNDVNEFVVEGTRV